ncbi:hypothetical protein HJFPF1_07800 [Paramyrothecium foliicola]|nr:hypothetical protein HJFPF1_07800 [Paramyrothecium foliicola]
MTSADPSVEPEGSPEPVTPRKTATSDHTTTPKSAPAATGGRPRANSKKPEPTLLTDFLLGRPSPARVAADREHRKSVEAVKAELRHEMRQNAVRKLQQPGGVKDRVKAWQKTNAAAMDAADANDAATEPTDVAWKDEDIESVTEEDRVRIKMRQQKRRAPIKKKTPEEEKPLESSQAPTGESQETVAPKKRVVSDTNWVKPRARRSPTRKVSPRVRKSPSPTRIPKDFVLRSANPPVAAKIKAWADKVEVPDTPPPRSYRSSKSRDSSTKRTEVEGEAPSETAASSSQATAKESTRPKSLGDDGIRVKPIRTKRVDDDGIRVKAIKTTLLGDDGIRVRPLNPGARNSRSRPASPPAQRRRSKTVSGIPAKARRSDGIEVLEEPSEVSTSQRTQTEKGGLDQDTIEVIEDIESMLETPTRESRGRHAKARPKSHHPTSSRVQDESSWISEDESARRSGSDLTSSLAAKSLADNLGDIPFGHSAFSELDLPLNGPARSRPKRAKVDRNTSFKGVPNVLKKVVEEGKKMIHEMNEPPKNAVPNNPPSIEKWLNNTVDPFVDAKSPEEESASPKPKPKAVEKEQEHKEREHREEEHKEREHKVREHKERERKERERKERERKERERKEREHKERKETPKRSSPGIRTSRKVSPKESTAMGSDLSSEVTTELSATTDTTQTATELTATELTAETATETATETTTNSESQRETESPPSAGLRRSRATRSSSSPWKSAGKRPFLGVLKAAFQGESTGYMKPPKAYQSHEERLYEELSELTGTDWTGSEYTGSELTESELQAAAKQRSSPEPPRGHALSDHTEPTSPTTPRMAGPRLRPPTTGQYELSTILSEESSSAIDSDVTSDLSNSTLTQSTNLTKDSDLSKSSSRGSGLKRRLTRHSDLVSVLSLPDNSNIPAGIKSHRSRPSLRKTRGASESVSVDELLREFADDENLYLRELKTLVDGVVPVLLSHVVGDGNITEIFGPGGMTPKVDGLAKSVIGMGVALEKMKSAHKKAPVADIRRLAHWAHGVVPIYNSYLSAWRLGFQDLVVNLAPRAEAPDDEDSLLDALPRNEHGDIVNAAGDRVDVAHLLKRPLFRVKQMVKFIKCVDEIVATADTQELLRDFEALHEKARRRHREEVARMTDEEAIGTDTSRARDIRTLQAMDSAIIDATRQVNAKDVFSLDLAHSNGQRLECKVELVHRDNQSNPDDQGDLLIREIGDGRRTYLLFQPLPMSMISARTGDGNFDMVVMVRAFYKGKEWHELLTLTTDNEDQILDWLDILPLSPVPPREPEPSIVGDLDELPSQKRWRDAPVGARHLDTESPRSPLFSKPQSPTPETPTKRPLPARYHPRSPATPTAPVTPPAPASPESPPSERTPTQDDYRRSDAWDEPSQPLAESMRPDPLAFAKKSPNSTPYRDDGAPPPPVHRTFTPPPQQGPSSPPSLQPPAEKAGSRIKRRTSSPLKHEYLPSDVSSGSETSVTEEESDPESSDDEIESVDIPETELGVSIRDSLTPPPAQSQLTESECSLTPSNSASQAGLHGHKTSPEENAQRFMASISRWSEKGLWKDIWETPCSVIVTAGLIEAYALHVGTPGSEDKPILALDLTPLVLIRQSTAVDLEIRSSVQPHCQLAGSQGGGNFRFRCHNGPDCFNLYSSVHHARLNNEKFIQLENEARFKSFGERKAPADNEDDTSSRRRSWFGRKNSYRSSVRAPTQSQDGASTTPSSSLSATSFLKRLTVAGNLSFNLARSSVDKQSRAGSSRNSLYTLGYSSASGTPPRSPSVSVGNSSRNMGEIDNDNIRIRLHLLVTSTKWEDFGNCTLQIRRPPPGWHQALRADHGLEKRITVTTLPKKDSEKPRVVLDAVLGSGCFSAMGSRGVVCGVWEEAKGANGVVGSAPATGPTGGLIKKWCFQCASVADAGWVLRLPRLNAADYRDKLMGSVVKYADLPTERHIPYHPPTPREIVPDLDPNPVQVRNVTFWTRRVKDASVSASLNEVVDFFAERAREAESENVATVARVWHMDSPGEKFKELLKDKQFFEELFSLLRSNNDQGYFVTDIVTLANLEVKDERSRSKGAGASASVAVDPLGAGTGVLGVNVAAGARAQVVREKGYSGCYEEETIVFLGYRLIRLEKVDGARAKLGRLLRGERSRGRGYTVRDGLDYWPAMVERPVEGAADFMAAKTPSVEDVDRQLGGGDDEFDAIARELGFDVEVVG